MQNNTLHATRVNDLKFLQDYIKTIDSSLTSLSHAMSGEINTLGTSLNKTPGIRNSRYLPRPPRPKLSSYNSNLIKSLLAGLNTNTNTGQTGIDYGLLSNVNSNAYSASNGQIWADIAAGITRALNRNS